MSRSCFGSIFVVNSDISKMSAETVTQSAARFADVYFSTYKVQYTQIDKISGNTREMITETNGSSLRSRNFVHVGDERSGPTRAHI